MTRPSAEAIRAAILDLAVRRGRGRTFCPSEVARALAGDWRPLMPAVRAEVARLQAQGAVVVTRRGRPVDAAAPGGPIRVALGDQPSGP